MKNTLLKPLNIPYHACMYLVGVNHKPKHRIIAGIFTMFVGVFIAHLHTQYIFVVYLYDMAGYAVHAVGMLPIGELLLTLKSNNK
jgi:hypothetical protein